jgi:3-phosphoinositide dependent protein kinase-1
VGTTYYIAPEMITDQDSVNPSVDLWAFGVILYRLMTGKYLFDEVNDYLTFEKIKSSEFELDKTINEQGKDLIKRLLHKVPSERIGFGEGGFKELKAHPFFESIDWDKINEMESPLKGRV